MANEKVSMPGGNAGDTANQQGPVEETIQVPKAAFEQMQRDLAALATQVNRPQQTLSRKAAEERLPEQNTIDQTKINNPVLSRDGWVVPHTFGSAPNAPKG